MAIDILMPSFAAGMEEATLVRWLKQEGEQIAKGEAIAEIETDKALMEMEAEAEGVLGRILIPQGSEGVPVGTVLAVLLGKDEDASTLVIADKVQATSLVPEPIVHAYEQTPANIDIQIASQKDRVFASPLARRLAHKHGIDLTSLTGSGPRGRIIRMDVERAHATVSAAPQQPGSSPAPDPTASAQRTERIPNSRMRKTIARRLSESKRQAPHFYLITDCQIDALLELRARLNAKGSKASPQYHISVNDMVVFAAARAMRRTPEVNATWSEDFAIRYLDVDVSVAVATANGLVTPVVREADRKGLAEIATEIRALAHKARKGKLTPPEYQGGGLTISNLGMYGIREFVAIINPPQAAILAVGAVEQRPIVKNNELAIGRVMTMTLSADHRIVDGVVGAQFLSELKSFLEDPLELLI